MVWTLDSSEVVLLFRLLAWLEVRLLRSGSLRRHAKARRLAEFSTLMLVNVNRFRLPVWCACSSYLTKGDSDVVLQKSCHALEEAGRMYSTFVM